jgi:hypothetical protein
MDPFLAIPTEVRQDILEGLPALRDLQSAVLSSRALHATNVASRRFIRPCVFLNQFDDLEAEYGAEKKRKRTPFEVASRWVSYLCKSDAYDGLILRDAIWPRLLANQEQSTTRAHGRATRFKDTTEVFCTWAAQLASSCREFHDEAKARHVETETLRLVPANSIHLGEAWLTWLQATMASCTSQGDMGYAGYICREIWSRFEWGPDHRHKPGLDGLALVRVIATLCGHFDGGIGAADPSAAGEVIAAYSLAWEYLRVQSATGDGAVHQPGMFCYRCLDGAKLLIEGAKRSRGAVGPGLPHLQTVWQGVQPRGMAFNLWSHLLVDSHSDRLTGVFKVWARLQQDRRETFLQDIDLDWARHTICLLRRSGAAEQSLSFQSEVFDLMSPRDRQYCAFGRNLADAYVKSGRMEDAVGVREKVLDELPAVSAVRPSWIIALARLYERTGRVGDAERLSTSLLQVD